MMRAVNTFDSSTQLIIKIYFRTNIYLEEEFQVLIRLYQIQNELKYFDQKTPFVESALIENVFSNDLDIVENVLMRKTTCKAYIYKMY